MKILSLYLALSFTTLSLGGCCSALCWFDPSNKEGVETPDTKVKKPTSSKTDPEKDKKN